MVSHSIQEADLSLGATFIALVLITIILPFQALILMPFQAWMVRLTLRGLAKNGDYPSFLMVLRLVCYSQVAGIASIVPIIGAWAAPIWNIYLLAIGLHVGLGQSKRNAFLAALTPVIVMILLFIFLAVLLLAGI